MKNRLRLALPPLTQITTESVMTFALFNRGGQLLRSGELPLAELAQALPVDNVQAILHPDDAIVVTISLPPLQAKRLDAAVQASVEPMALSDISNLCIAYGPRTSNGDICVTWAERGALLRVWQLLSDAGINLVALVPQALALPKNDPHPELPLTLPIDTRWQAVLPSWSLARPQWRPAAKARRWRGAAWWTAAAALVWLVGLQVYAAQLRTQARQLQASTEQAIRTAFTSVSVIIDPVRQAQNERDKLRLANGVAGDDDFIPMAIAAAKILPFADGHVTALHYQNGQLSLVLAEGYTPPSNETALHQAAAVQSLILEKDDKSTHTWRIRRNAIQPNQAVGGTQG